MESCVLQIANKIAHQKQNEVGQIIDIAGKMSESIDPDLIRHIVEFWTGITTPNKTALITLASKPDCRAKIYVVKAFF